MRQAHLQTVCMVRMLLRRPGSSCCIWPMLRSWYSGSQASSKRFRYLWVSFASFIASVSCMQIQNLKISHTRIKVFM